MTDYRRNRVPGGTFFFTVNLYDRKRRLLVQHIDLLRDAVRKMQRRAPLHIDAWVVLPDHMHCLWTLPDGDARLPPRDDVQFNPVRIANMFGLASISRTARARNCGEAPR